MEKHSQIPECRHQSAALVRRRRDTRICHNLIVRMRKYFGAHRFCRKVTSEHVSPEAYARISMQPKSHIYDSPYQGPKKFGDEEQPGDCDCPTNRHSERCA